MPRSVADATRFTPTGPHAFTQAPVASGGETPQQRVARLREAARKAKAEKAAGSTFDRLLDRGRIWADRAHRVVAVGLMGATVICAGVTIYAFTDLVMYTRKKKADYAAAMKAQGLDPATAQPQRVDVAVIDSVPVTTPTTPSAATPVKPESKADIGPVEGPWTKFKSWALSGMTPADKEYKTAFERAQDEERAQAEKVIAPVVAATTRESTNAGEKLGADDLRGEKTKAESGGILSSVTGWWSKR